jgi:hypothetical protein
MAALLLAIAAISSTALAQETTGAIRGRVVDSQGLPIPGVTVTATGPQGAQTAVSDTDGRFTFRFLTLATYRIRAELQGFKTAEQSNVIVGLGQTADVPLKMEVGGVAETVNSYSIVFGSLGNTTPFDFIKEVQVKTGGYEAEFGQSTGGVINVVTKSGSNEVRGSLFGYARPDKVEGTWTKFQSINGSVQTLGTRNYDAGVEGGGPILKDRVFFFGAIDPSWDWRTLQALDGFPLIDVGGVDRERRSVSYSAKGTWAIASGHRIDASLFGDPSTGFNGPQRTSALLRTTTSAFSSLDYGGHNQTVRYDGVVSGNFLLEGYYARALNRIVETPSVDSWSVVDRTVSPAVTTGGIGF